MKCPNCESKKAVEIGIRSEGYTSSEFPTKECGVCGAVWRLKPGDDSQTVVDMIKQGSTAAAA